MDTGKETKKSSYPGFQTTLIDSLIPEISEDGINLNSSSEFDRLITHLELSFYNREALPIPSTNIIRILFTLASRSPDSNWTVSNSLLDDIPTSRQRIKPKSSFYEDSNGKGNLCDRSIKLIDKYIQELPNEKLYKNLTSFMNDFMELSGRRNRTKMPQKYEDVLVIMRQSPKKRMTSSECVTQSDIDDSDNADLDEVGDSEDDDDESGGTTHRDDFLMEQEINKYQNMPVENKYNFNDGPNQSGVNNPSVLFNRDDSPVPKPKWQGIKVYDESLLSNRLSPRLNDFDLWRLINFTFYCAGRRNIVFDSTYESCHMIYTAQAATIDKIFSIIEINLVKEFSEMFPDGKDDPYKWLFKQSLTRRMLAMDQISQNSTLFLLNLLKQLGYLRNNWYDRIAEYVFNGLVCKESPLSSKTESQLRIPTTCYEHERILLKKSFNKYKAETEKFAYYNDNIDSMKLRFKIINTVHYWSLAFDKVTRDGITRSERLNTNFLEPAVLIDEVAKKFMVIEYDYWVEFYYSLLMESSIPLNYRDILLVNLSSKLLHNLTGSRQWSFKLYPRDDKKHPDWRSSNFKLVLDWMKDRELYLSFIEDETYQSFAHFKELWKKYNFVLGWVFSFALRDVTEVGYDTLIKKEFLQSACKQMDILREQVYMQFIKNCKDGSNDLPFKLTITEANKLESEPRSWEKFTSIISNTLLN
ncbi:MAG: hypothetical protein M5F18_03045 [Asgard group archaeon]|nr:hypothetical protein [Asgard group archaeon]